MFRPHCSHLQANSRGSNAFSVRTIWDPIVGTIVMRIMLALLNRISMDKIFYP